MIAEHAAAVLALLRAVPGLVVHDGQVPPGAVPPYVVVYLVGASTGPTTLAGRAEHATTRAYCHAVGANAAAARIVADRVAGALLNARPVIPGCSAGLIRHEQSLPPQRDESTGVLLMDAVAVYRFDSHPA
ncbi:hypothetical protein Lfu02_79830 [Longispora fulva]|uniref:DUF3168 domain-containing protein n=1 Tax=Longispora fulva TaxID=619741 RepID=A0A8J7GXT8_9ACTN|nr:hypothetical protein [Longispora fulva]MBG6141134.1 hypothetical protein [Longispora fulva]GIG63611.1 hypothetical protein Lfu02_79830 [Longispora fulva]